MHDLIGSAVDGFGLDAGVNLIIDVVHDDEIVEGEGDLSGEPIQFADGCDLFCDLVNGRQFVAIFFWY